MMEQPQNPPAGADLPHQILAALDASGGGAPVSSADAFPAVPFAEIKAALDRLMARDMVRYETIERQEALLEPEGAAIAASGSHEARVFEVVRAALEGLTVQELEAAVGDKAVVKIGQGKAFKEKWIAKTAGMFFSSS